MAEVVHRIGEIEAEMSGGSERSIEEKRRITRRPGQGLGQRLAVCLGWNSVLRNLSTVFQRLLVFKDPKPVEHGMGTVWFHECSLLCNVLISQGRESLAWPHALCLWGSESSLEASALHLGVEWWVWKHGPSSACFTSKQLEVAGGKRIQKSCRARNGAVTQPVSIQQVHAVFLCALKSASALRTQQTRQPSWTF